MGWLILKTILTPSLYFKKIHPAMIFWRLFRAGAHKQKTPEQCYIIEISNTPDDPK